MVRDLGPNGNWATLDAYPGRTAYVYAITTPNGSPQVLGYAEGMALLWGEDRESGVIDIEAGNEAGPVSDSGSAAGPG